MANVNLLKGSALSYIEGLISTEKTRAENRENQIAATVFSVPIGGMLLYGGATPPANFMFCSGQEISRTTYAELFSINGASYGGGNGTSTFNLPDLRDRVPLGFNNMGGADAARVNNAPTARGNSGGTDQHILQAPELPAHNHQIDIQSQEAGGHTHNFYGSRGFDSGPVNGWNGDFGTGQGRRDIRGGPAGSIVPIGHHSHRVLGNTQSVGSGNAHNNMQPYLAVGYIIRVR